MYHEHLDLWKSHLLLGIREDGWPWDWTALGTSSGYKDQANRTVSAKVIAKSEGFWAGEGLVQSLKEITKSLQIESDFQNGMSFKPGDLLLEAKGEATEIHAFERPFLNLASYVCGITTATARIVSLVKQACPHQTPRVSMTRKTLPGYRDIAIYGVRAGGGYPHRVTLSGGVLIKENHIAVAGSIQQAVVKARAVAPHGLKIEIEVRSLCELKEAHQARADGVLLDNFTPNEAREAIDWIRQNEYQPFIEVSGGLNETTISEYAIPGVQVLSVGSITHSVKSADFSLLFNG